MTTAEKLARIMELSVRINQETEFVSFVNFAGHVEALDLSIAMSGEGSWRNENRLAIAEIPMRAWNPNYERQLDDLINALQFVVVHHAIPESLPVYNSLHSSTRHGLCKTKLSQGCNLNESALQNTSTEAYLNLDQSVKEVI